MSEITRLRVMIEGLVIRMKNGLFKATACIVTRDFIMFNFFLFLPLH